MLDRFIRSRGYIKPYDVLITVSIPSKKRPHYNHLLRMTVAYILAIQQLQGNIELGTLTNVNPVLEVTLLK